MSTKEKDSLVAAGWSYEGIGWYSDENKTASLYRQYNPNVDPKASRGNSGSHNYTTSKTENDSLVRVGWKEEGIGWYAITAGYSYKYQPTVQGANEFCEHGARYTGKGFTYLEYGSEEATKNAADKYFATFRDVRSPAYCGLYFNYNTGEYIATQTVDKEFLENEEMGIIVQIGYCIY